jgi:hypothetical protein
MANQDEAIAHAVRELQDTGVSEDRVRAMYRQYADGDEFGPSAIDAEIERSERTGRLLAIFAPHMGEEAVQRGRSSICAWQGRLRLGS